MSNTSLLDSFVKCRIDLSEAGYGCVSIGNLIIVVGITTAVLLILILLIPYFQLNKKKVKGGKFQNGKP